jgi:hypothetical protein
MLEPISKIEDNKQENIAFVLDIDEEIFSLETSTG